MTTEGADALAARSIRAITLHQPWASLMALGVKRVETRSWATDYRGRIAVHAGRVWTTEYQEVVQTWPFGDCLDTRTIEAIDSGALRGCIVAIGTLTRCFGMTESVVRRMEAYGVAVERDDAGPETRRYGLEWHFGLWEPGRHGWLIEDVRPIDPIPCRGMQGLWPWTPPDALELPA